MWIRLCLVPLRNYHKSVRTVYQGTQNLPIWHNLTKVNFQNMQNKFLQQMITLLWKLILKLWFENQGGIINYKRWKHGIHTGRWTQQRPENVRDAKMKSKASKYKRKEKKKPLGHSATILSLSIGMVEAGEYRKGPISDPSNNRNLSSIKSSSGIWYPCSLCLPINPQTNKQRN